jgi:hypothetical protein
LNSSKENIMKISPTQASLILAAAVVYALAGCAPAPSRLDSTFGTSLNTIKAYQTLNPTASANTASPTIDGPAAQEIMGRYVKSYSAPEPQQNVFSIGVSGGAH